MPCQWVKSRTIFFLDVYLKNPECFILLALDKYFLPPDRQSAIKNFTVPILWLLFIHVNYHWMKEVKAVDMGAQVVFSCVSFTASSRVKGRGLETENFSRFHRWREEKRTANSDRAAVSLSREKPWVLSPLACPCGVPNQRLTTL